MKTEERERERGEYFVCLDVSYKEFQQQEELLVVFPNEMRETSEKLWKR